MNPQAWANSNLGKSHLNPDPPHGIDGQCVNAASSWSLSIGGPELMGETAYHIWINFRHPFYEVHPYQSGVGPQAGDIVFFAPNVAAIGTGYAGHVDVCAQPVSATQFGGADADWGQLPLKYVIHPMTGVVGWFRKAGQVNPQQQAQLQKEVVDTNRRNMLEGMIFKPGQQPSLKDPKYGIGGYLADVISDMSTKPGRYNE